MAAMDKQLLEQMVELVQQAGEITLKHFQDRGLDVEHKADGSPVTVADRAAERFLREELAKRFPNDALEGEEEEAAAGTSGRRWIMDPIDGTKAFTRGVPLYSNLLALYDGDTPLAGVIHLPPLRQTIYAGVGLGCFLNGEPARVSETRSLKGAYIMTSAIEDWSPDQLARAKEAGALIRTWGDAYGYALVATGRADAMLDVIIQPYDVAAMPVILSEAGGRYTDLHGEPRIDTGDGIGTNGRLHDELVKLLGR